MDDTAAGMAKLVDLVDQQHQPFLQATDCITHVEAFLVAKYPSEFEPVAIPSHGNLPEVSQPVASEADS